MKIYVTKYAMTIGVCVYDGEPVSKNMVEVKCPGAPNNRAYYHGNEWHLIEENAKACFEEMKKKKIASLEKSLKKIKSLEYKVTHDYSQN